MPTNQRFIYSKHSFAKLAVMGVLANPTEGEYHFYFTKLEKWKIAFHNVMEQAQYTDMPQAASVQSVTDELLKFKSLLDAGVYNTYDHIQ